MDKTKTIRFFPIELPQPTSRIRMDYEGDPDEPFILYTWENADEQGFNALKTFLDSLIDTYITGWKDPATGWGKYNIKLSDIKKGGNGDLFVCAFIIADTSKNQ
ncbi:hypothetical protein [Pseudodesulfovibrio sp. JC047]|uniref:hypothetical protein n=1 Tax=Pseudodesulfovibrio sp. JC047 TaxID=2683199 RepID=UPI0013D630D0|nr:hypothetical protein [Pseudodesulfovibrio sp. JC047]